MLQEIERSIMIANLGFNPMNNGDTIIISVPPLTEERRHELAKQAKSEVEEAKISIRAARKDANTEIKKTEDASEDIQKNAEMDVQVLTDTHVKKADDLYTSKEKEILTV
jgi:ribosome recycling factor